MPIRFRCVYCSRLLGIASRKAGAVTRCPQCGNEIIVPLRSDDENEETVAAESPPFRPEPLPQLEYRAEEPPAPRPSRGLDFLGSEAPLAPGRSAAELRIPDPLPAPNPPPSQTAPKPTARPRPKGRPGEEPLFIGDDIDDLLGLPKGRGKGDLDERLAGPKPVSGMDAMSLEDDPHRSIVLTPQRATLLVVAMVVLLGLAFAAGVMLGMNTTRGG